LLDLLSALRAQCQHFLKHQFRPGLRPDAELQMGRSSCSARCKQSSARANSPQRALSVYDLAGSPANRSIDGG
jgi:hypothetical protein